MPLPLPASPIARLVLGLALWVPVMMALWWLWGLPYLVTYLPPLVRPALEAVLGTHVIGLSTMKGTWMVHTDLALVQMPLLLAGVPVAPDRFTVALPLFCALVLATPRGRRVYRLLLGSMLLVLPLVLVMVLLYVQFQIARMINHQPYLADLPPAYYVLALPYPAWAFHLMGVGRQLALLVLPVLGPVMAWAVVHRGFLAELVGSGRGRPEGSSGEP